MTSIRFMIRRPEMTSLEFLFSPAPRPPMKTLRNSTRQEPVKRQVHSEVVRIKPRFDLD